jgi:hypothetical protein
MQLQTLQTLQIDNHYELETEDLRDSVVAVLAGRAIF